MPKGVYQRETIVVECQLKTCRMPFEARKGGQPRLYCSDAHKQAAYRVRRWKAAQEAKNSPVTA